MREEIQKRYRSGQSIRYISRKAKLPISEIEKIVEGIEDIVVKPNRALRNNLSGQKFAHLLVTEMKITSKSKDRSYRCICLCDCGRKSEAVPNYLIKGITKTCGDKDCEFHRQEYSNSGEKNIKYTGYKEISGQKFASYRCGAIRRGYNFDVKIEYLWNLFLEQNRKCKLTGLNIFFGKTNTSECTASLDRIDSNLGYIESNVMWVHKDVNFMKNDYELDYFISICKLISTNSN